MYNKLLFAVLSFLLIIASNAQTYKLSVTTNIPDGRKLYLLKDFPSGNYKIDSAIVSNHQFEFSRTNDVTPYVYNITKTEYQRPPWFRFIWDGNVSIFLDSTIGEIEKSSIKNSPLTIEYKRHINEDFSSVQDSLLQVIKAFQNLNAHTDSLAYVDNIRQQQNFMKEVCNIEKEYIKMHPASFINLESLNWLWFQMDANEKVEYYNVIDWKHINHPYKQYFDSLLQNESEVAIGKRVDFSLQTTTKKTVTLNNFKGKNVLIDFWGSWCGPCIRGIPELKKIYAKYHQTKQLDILSISVEREDDGPQKAKDVIAKCGMNWLQVVKMGKDLSSVLDAYKVAGFPTQVLLDKQGKIRLYVYGLTDDNVQKLETALEQIKN